MTCFQLRTIRLINFHNFVDETIAVRDGGHLFLLGDNGSGKTTVLDAVHLVLAGGDLELNAAARIGGRRDDGRTLQGVVLRYDFEHGARNQGGAIAYAAIELVDPASGRHLTLGIGAEATTMEARVAKWGFVVARPLAEVALLDAASRPLDRDALRRQLGPAHVHAPLAAYRKELARRLFASERQYDEAVRFWGMAKAYREIVAGARDFGALFERLLPAPDSAVFEEILKTLRAIDDLDVAVRDLDVQREYVGGLAARARDVSSGREAATRYRWLACRREQEEAVAAGARAATEAAGWTHAARRLAIEAEAARLRSERADDVLRRAEGDDAAGILGAVREAEARRRHLALDAMGADAEAEDRRRERDRLAGTAVATRTALATCARSAASELRAVVAAVTELPGDLGAVTRLADELDRMAPPAAASAVDGATAPAVTPVAALPEVAAATAAHDVLLDERQRALIEAQVGARAALAQQAACAATLAELEAVSEAGPALPGHTAARRALASASIAAQPLYELLEPSADADPAVLAAIEALVGDDVLGALLVADDQRGRAREIVAAAAPGIRIVVAAGDAALPDWCAAALSAPPAATSAPRSLAEIAISVLAAALIQPPGLGAVEPPAAGDVALRGLGHRVAHDTPRLLGAAARRRAHAARIDGARAALAGAELARRDAERGVDLARAAVERTQRLGRAIAAACGATLVAAWHAASAALHRSELATASWRDALGRAGRAGARLAELDGEIGALRARIDGVDLDELERRLATLRGVAETTRASWHQLLADQAQAAAEARSADARGAAAVARRADLTAQLAEATRLLRAAMAAIGADPLDGDDDALAHHVRVTLRGDSFRSLDTVRQRIADEDRAADAAADELERDGSHGVRSLAHAARFGFVYQRTRNHIEDRRGQPLAGVLAELDRSIAEQRSVVNDRTRTLMDTLVMGELARHLQGQVHHLYETIKGINRVLRGLRFGPTEYQFQVTPRTDRSELIELVRRLSILDEDSRHQFRAWIDARLDELRTSDDQVPALLDYRRWFEFKLRMSTTDAEGVELTHRLRQVGSGGEQGVPNYLLVLALAKLMFDAAGATVRPLLFDEAFYGIDGGRRDQLLRLATDLGLQVLVASPDQDGATPAVRAATTLFVVKDADHDVHLAPYHYWNHAHGDQPDLFARPPDPADAACRT